MELIKTKRDSKKIMGNFEHYVKNPLQMDIR